MKDRDALLVDFSALLEAQPAPDYSAKAHPWDAGLFLSFADTDYLVFRWLALGDCPREATFNLHQAVEKYLKSLLLAADPAFTKTKGHKLDIFAERAAALFPVLADRTFLLFCKHLSPYQWWGHYPERIFNQTYMKPNWNTRHRDGISEMDLVIATLRETAITAMGRHADSAYFLEGIVHRDDYWLVDQEPPISATHLAMRTALLRRQPLLHPGASPNARAAIPRRTCLPLAAATQAASGVLRTSGLESACRVGAEQREQAAFATRCSGEEFGG